MKPLTDEQRRKLSEIREHLGNELILRLRAFRQDNPQLDFGQAIDAYYEDLLDMYVTQAEQEHEDDLLDWSEGRA